MLVPLSDNAFPMKKCHNRINDGYIQDYMILNYKLPQAMPEKI